MTGGGEATSKRTGLEAGDILTDTHNDASAFVTKAIFAAHNHWAYAAMLPEMHIGPTDAGGAHVYQAVGRAGLRNITLNEVQVVLRICVDGDVCGLALQDVVWGRRHGGGVGAGGVDHSCLF